MKRLAILFLIALVGWFAVGRHLPQANPKVGLEGSSPAPTATPAATPPAATK